MKRWLVLLIRFFHFALKRYFIPKNRQDFLAHPVFGECQKDDNEYRLECKAAHLFSDPTLSFPLNHSEITRLLSLISVLASFLFLIIFIGLQKF